MYFNYNKNDSILAIVETTYFSRKIPKNTLYNQDFDEKAEN